MRQGEQKYFRDTLNGIVDEKIARNDYDLLSSKFHIKNSDGDSFKNSVFNMLKSIEVDRCY